MSYNDNGYLDPLHIVWRKGTSDDPYTDKVEYLKVVHQKIVLSEIPDKFSRVKIGGMEEVNVDRVTHLTLSPNQFSVNYSTGVIQVHQSKEAETLNVIYKGRGFIQYPSERIYHRDKFNDISKSLGQIIDESLQFLDDVTGKTADYEAMRNELVNRISEATVAIDEANEAKDGANIATDKALDAYDTTRLVFKPYVNTYADIGIQYPLPEIGWTTQVYNTGIRYRYDGIEWVEIDLFGGNIPTATSTRDGLMSKEDYTKLQNLEAEMNGMSRERVLTFVFPYLNSGVNTITARFPFNGNIKSVKGICTKVGTDTMTEIDIEKSTDMINWNTIFDTSFLTFDIDSHFDNGSHIVLANNVTANDLFRINVRTLSTVIEGVTIEVVIELI